MEKKKRTPVESWSGKHEKYEGTYRHKPDNLRRSNFWIASYFGHPHSCSPSTIFESRKIYEKWPEARATALVGAQSLRKYEITDRQPETCSLAAFGASKGKNKEIKGDRRRTENRKVVSQFPTKFWRT